MRERKEQFVPYDFHRVRRIIKTAISSTGECVPCIDFDEQDLIFLVKDRISQYNNKTRLTNRQVSVLFSIERKLINDGFFDL